MAKLPVAGSLASILLWVSFALAGCGEGPGGTRGGRGTTRLVELFDPALVSHSPREVARVEPTEWRFDAAQASEPGSSGGWHAAAGVEGLHVEDGRLKGRTSDPLPVIWGARVPGGEESDTVHSLEIRMRATRGANLYFSFQGGTPPDTERPRAYWSSAPEHLQIPIVADGEMRTYTVEPRGVVAMKNVSALLLAPSDESGADFEIESVRLVSEKEYMATIPAGVGWHVARGVWRESIVARVPETIRFQLALPERAWLDLSGAVLDHGPVTFRVSVKGADGWEVLDEHSVTAEQAWAPMPVELRAWSGKAIELELALVASKEGATCLWGAPVVRERVAPESAPGPQGVIVILADTLRADHLPVAGYPRETARALTVLARQGALFSDCTAQATWTQPSTASLVTSLHPASHGVIGLGNKLADEAETMAEVFRDAGFATIGYSSVKFTGRFTNLQQGFEVLHEADSLPDEKHSKSATVFVTRLLPWLEEHTQDRFFVLLHVFDPHDPYEPRTPFDATWADAAEAEVHREEARRVREHIADPALKEIGMPSREELEAAGIDADRWLEYERAWYDGSILGMDQDIGRLMQGIKSMGLLQKTLVVFTSDHGEEFFDHGRMWHGQSVYGELTHVPLVLFGAGVPKAGVVIDEPVRSIDIMPTLLEVFDLRAPAHLQGQSMVPLLRTAAGLTVPADAWAQRPIVTEKPSLADERFSPPPRRAGMVAISDGRWKLIHNEPREEGKPEWELYDRAADPLDRHDVAAENPDIVERLQRELADWRAEVGGVRLDAGHMGELDAEELRAMRALGYAK